MRKLFYLFVGFSVVGTIVFLTGCNNNSGGGGNPGAGAAVPPAFFGTCGGVLNGASQGTVGFATYSAPIQGYANTNALGATMQVSSGFEKILREAMNLCDRSSGTSIGWTSCAAQISSSVNTISLVFNPQNANRPRLLISSKYVQTGNFSYGFTSPNFKDLLLGIVSGNPTIGMSQLPMMPDLDLQNTSIWPINNSQGFQVRTQGPQYSLAGLKRIDLDVPSGKCEDGSFQFQLKYQGELAASGTMVRVTQ